MPKAHPSYEDLEALAPVLYRVFTERTEELDAHRLASATGCFEDANDYTQRTFRLAVTAVVEAWEALRGDDDAPA